MAVAFSPSVFFDEVASLLASEPSTADLFAFRPSEPVSERLHWLLEKNSESVLTAEEQAELTEMLRLGRLLDAIVLKARLRLAGKA